MPSRKTVLLGAGALALVVLVVVLAKGGAGPSPKIGRTRSGELNAPLVPLAR